MRRKPDLARFQPCLYALALMPVNFSSRCVAMGLPWLVLAVEPQRHWNLTTFNAAAIGCTAGATALLGYYNY